MQIKLSHYLLGLFLLDTSARRPYDDALILVSSITGLTAGVNWKVFNGKFPWIPETATLPVTAKGTLNKLVPAEIKGKGHDIYLFEGYIKVPEDGGYTFYLTAAGKSFLRIHEAILIDEDYNYPPGTIRESTVKLKAGMHPFKMYYMGKPVAGALNLEWKGPSFNKMPISATAFYK